MTLDPELQPIIDLVGAVEQPSPTEDRVAEMRSAFAGLIALFGPGSAEVTVSDRTVPGPSGGVPVRVYRPDGPGPEHAGALVWFHGGGWVIGDLDTHDALCRDLAVGAGHTVVSVGYRLAPEHRYPAAHEDCRVVVERLLTHAADFGVDPRRLALGGDSAGGQLATVVARQLRDRNTERAARGEPALPQPVAQVLVYPVTDLAGGAAEHPSRKENASGYLLTAETMDFFTDAYVPEPEVREHPDASPLRAPDLGDLPPALVVVAGFDPLRDEGIAYVERLRAAGVATVLEHLEGGVHLCAQMPSTVIGRELVDRIAAFVAERLGGFSPGS